MAFPNHYTHRRVAETKAKSCDICFKLSSSVLITPDNKVRLSSHPNSPAPRHRPAGRGAWPLSNNH
jgi:hypothetical protein